MKTAYWSIYVVLGVVNAFVRGCDLGDLVNLPQVGDRARRRAIPQWDGLAANILLGLALFHAAAKDGVPGRILPASVNASKGR